MASSEALQPSTLTPEGEASTPSPAIVESAASETVEPSFLQKAKDIGSDVLRLMKPSDPYAITQNYREF